MSVGCFWSLAPRVDAYSDQLFSSFLQFLYGFGPIFIWLFHVSIHLSLTYCNGMVSRLSTRIVFVTNRYFVYVFIHQLSTSYQPASVYFLLPISTIYKVFLCFYYNLFCIYMDFRISTSDAPSDLNHMSHVIWGSICGQTHASGVILLRSNDLPWSLSHYCCMGGIHDIYTHTPLRTLLILLHSSATITQCRGVYHYCCHINTRYYRYARTIPRY